MTTQLRKAARQALEALEADELDMVDDGSGHMEYRIVLAITALRAALEQPAQEEPKRKWVSLTDEERTEIRSKVQVYTAMDNIQYGLAIQRATETKLKEKNT